MWFDISNGDQMNLPTSVEKIQDGYIAARRSRRLANSKSIRMSTVVLGVPSWDIVPLTPFEFVSKLGIVRHAQCGENMSTQTAGKYLHVTDIHLNHNTNVNVPQGGQIVLCSVFNERSGFSFVQKVICIYYKNIFKSIFIHDTLAQPTEIWCWVP